MLKQSARHTTLQAVLLSLAIFASHQAIAAEECDSKHDFPTPVIADYVLGCMAANGNDYDSLHKCSCSIDFISSRISYEEYEKAQTVMQVKLDRGQRGLFYRESSWAKTTIELLEKVQAESTLRCF
ncbi:MAG: hypothetical protein KTR32_36275 [Granulosicoccus sp.]|nr:hypothetical protein [Granulosicoccus sp.]